MCLIVFAHRAHAQFPLVVAANRDEYYARPTAQAAYWEDNPAILAGRDLECMGSWMGVTRSGRFAAVTNFRDPADAATGAESRGTLVSRFLAGEDSPGAFLEAIAANASAYRGFNLLASDGKTLHYFSNRGGTARQLEPGIYGLSNHFLDTPWPKLMRARERLGHALVPGPAPESLFALLADTSVAADAELPNTGVEQPRERMLSAARIVSDTYGTRCSSVLMRGADGRFRYAERSYGPAGIELDTVRFEFELGIEGSEGARGLGR